MHLLSCADISNEELNSIKNVAFNLHAQSGERFSSNCLDTCEENGNGPPFKLKHVHAFVLSFVEHLLYARGYFDSYSSQNLKTFLVKYNIIASPLAKVQIGRHEDSHELIQGIMQLITEKPIFKLHYLTLVQTFRAVS